MNLEKLLDTKSWTIREYLTILPISGAFVLNLFVIIAFRDFGTLGVTIMFSLIAGATPYFIWNYIKVKHIKDAEDQLPTFLRDLVESVRGGMSLDVAIRNATKADYGRLSPEVSRIYHQMTWGVPFDKALQSFSNRMRESSLITRTVKIIIEARRSGGDVLSVMETIAADVSTIKESEKDRKSSTSKQVMVMYVIYFMFIGIVIALTKILIPLTSLSEVGGLGVDIATGPCQGTLQGLSGGICGFFISMSNIFGLGEGSVGYYKALFLSMIIVQGLSSGLIAGQIGEDSVYAGVKHSLILTSIGFSIFMIISKAGGV